MRGCRVRTMRVGSLPSYCSGSMVSAITQWRRSNAWKISAACRSCGQPVASAPRCWCRARSQMLRISSVVTQMIAMTASSGRSTCPAFSGWPNIRQFAGLGEGKEPPILLDDMQALIVEASLLIALTMFVADVLRAKLDPRARL
jgi:hypothetical protein